MPFLLGSKLLFYSLIGVCLLIVIFSRVVYGITNWPMTIFTAAFILSAIYISQLIERQSPWVQNHKIWLTLMVAGLLAAFLSLIGKAVWIRRNWRYVAAKCLERDVWKDLGDGPDAGKTWYFRLLCEFELDGRTYRVTPSYWRTFATQTGVSNFLKRKISSEGWCLLRVNPANPLQAEIGPDYDDRVTN